ncbi:hypothetical protein P8452_42974 [Trifolium repens]|nr:hypothetical protein P8452_42974 [Trifolium repens]
MAEVNFESLNLDEEEELNFEVEEDTVEQHDLNLCLCEVRYAMERDSGRRSWSNEIRAEVRRPGGRVDSRWLREEGRTRDDMDVNGTSEDRGSHHNGPTHTNVAPPRESSSGPDNVVIVSTDSGHIPPSRPTFVRHPCTSQGSTIEAPVVSLISHRPILALTNDNVTTNQPTAASSLNQGGNNDMDTQVERKRRRAEGLVAIGSEDPHHLHFLSAAIDVEGRSGGLAVLWNDSNIPIEGHAFTWIKSQGTPHVIEERLDRAMASTSWLHLFPHNSWLREPDLEDVVIEGWGGSENLEVAIPSYIMSGGLGVVIIFVLYTTPGCVGVTIDGCLRLNQQGM